MPDLRLVIPAVVVWCAAIVLVGVPEYASASGIGAFALCAVWAGTLLVGRGGGTLTLLLVSCALLGLVGCRVATGEESRTPAELERLLSDRTELCAEFLIMGTPESAASGFGDGLFVSATMRSVGPCAGEGPHVSLSAPVQLLAERNALRDAEQRTVTIGWVVSGSVRLSPTTSGDQQAYRARLDSSSTQVSPPGVLLQHLNGLRASFLELSRDMPGRGGQLLPGLAIGDTTLVSEELESDMVESSLTHLTAVSGANCAVITGLIMGVGRWCGLRRRTRLIAATAALLAFVLLVTPEPSVLRAAVMSLVVMLSLGTGRPGAGLSSLAVAVIGLVLWDPWLARHYGFVLSVLATAGLLALSGPLTERLRVWFPAWIAAALAVPLAAQLTCQPVLILLQPVLPVYGVLANLAAAPAAPIATIVGLIACVCAPGVPGLARVAIEVAWWPSSWIAQIAEVSSSLPGAQVSWVSGVLGALLLGMGTAMGVIVLRLSARRGYRPILRPVLLLAIALVAGAGLGGANGRGWYAQLTHPAEWSYVMCDVGQGDAVLINAGTATVLVDVGPYPTLIRDCLDLMGVEVVDLLVLSHYDQDHVGGLEGVLGQVREAVVAPTVGESREGVVLDSLDHAGIPVQTGLSGDVGVVGDSAWRVWAPDSTDDADNSNDLSVVLEVNGPRGSAIFLGDLGESAQRRLLATMRDTGSVPHPDVVKVSHHGSRDQCPEFYRELGAPVALVSVGQDNGYGHPTDDALSLLSAAGSSVARTDELGTVALSREPEGPEWVVWNSGTSAEK
ncbi:competence protein ComEC [Klugiella xanthotipulae]|uniref:Competence protein ComEC n=2 Tax=Klugiella xanthotipulae TaxID=244735 RepID=A0A543HSD7_9MICO|nr:competence protein ComEC [Klugiella xanthotipulae]